MNNMLKILALMGIGATAYILFEKMCPECACDMKESLENLTKDAGKKMKNMME